MDRGSDSDECETQAGSEQLTELVLIRAEFPTQPYPSGSPTPPFNLNCICGPHHMINPSYIHVVYYFY